MPTDCRHPNNDLRSVIVCCCSLLHSPWECWRGDQNFFAQARGGTRIFLRMPRGGQNFFAHAKAGGEDQKKLAPCNHKQTAPLPVKNDSSLNIWHTNLHNAVYSGSKILCTADEGLEHANKVYAWMNGFTTVAQYQWSSGNTNTSYGTHSMTKMYTWERKVLS